MAAWNSLGVDLVGRILKHLPCFAHRVAFRAVCKHWRSVAAQVQQPPQLPWLLLPSAAAQAPGFFCILCRTIHPAFLPDNVRTARCCSSHPGGWFVLALHQREGGHALHNLHTGQRLAIPGLLITVDGISEIVRFVEGAALSAAPTVAGACHAVALIQFASPIAFWIPGMGHLSPPTPVQPHERASWRQMLPQARVHDMIYFAGNGLEGFHVLTETEVVLVYVPEIAPDGALTTRLVIYRFPFPAVSWEPVPWYTVRRYLLNFFGRLLMVVRFVSRDDGRTRWINVFRLHVLQNDNHGHRVAFWWKTRFADNVVAILGRFSSRAFASPDVALSGIYFLDDARRFEDVLAPLQADQPLPFPCTDMGRCTDHHPPQQFDSVFPIRPPSEFSPAAWFFH